MKRRKRAPAIFAQQLIEFAFSDRLPAIHLNTQKKRTLFHPCVSSWKNKLCLLALGSPDNEPLPPPPLYHLHPGFSIVSIFDGPVYRVDDGIRIKN
jgi:hypothetical protein